MWCAANMGRMGVGIELKPSYFEQARANLADLDSRSDDLFGEMAA